MIELPEQEDALCFNVDDKPGTIFNLVRDQLAGEYGESRHYLKLTNL